MASAFIRIPIGSKQLANQDIVTQHGRSLSDADGRTGSCTRWHQEQKLKIKEFSPISGALQALYVAYVIGTVPLNTIFVIAVSDLVNSESTDEV